MFKLISKLPSILQAEIDLVNTSTTRNNKVNRIKVFNPYDHEDFVIVSQNELDNYYLSVRFVKIINLYFYFRRDCMKVLTS